MKTLTEFSTLTLRKAAAARAAAGGARTPQAAAPAPAEAAPATGGDAPNEDAASDAAPAEDASASSEAQAAATEATEATASVDAPADTDAKQAAPTSPPDPAIDAVATALGVQPDRAARLLEALDIVGSQIDQVRLVRVYQGETGPTGAVSRGEFHYVIDRVAGARPRREERRDDRAARGGRGGGDRGGGGGGGRSGPGGDRRDKPRGLGSLKAGAKVEQKDDDRPARGEMPHAGIGWQLTAAPRDFKGPGRGGPRKGPGRGRPDDRRGPRVEDRGPRRDGGGPGGGRGPGGPGGPGGNRDRGPRGFGPRDTQIGPAVETQGSGRPADAQQPQGPRLGPDGQPLPPRSKRPRKPMGPDANGMGPDGKPWDPERRAKRETERGVGVNSQPPANVEGQTPAAPTENTSESPNE